MDEVLAMGHQIGEDNLGLSFKQVSRWEQGWAEPRPPYTKILCRVFGASAQELGLYDPTEATSDATLATAWQIDSEEDGLPSKPQEKGSTKRRDLLKLTLATAVAPEALGRILRGAAAEAMEFTRLTEVSLVGPGTFDHLEAVLTDLDRSYSKESPAEMFVVARAYRVRIKELIQGPHTLKEARDLYAYAAWLSEALAWLAHDLGSPLTAEAYAIDCYAHADQAGHDELCAWAMDAMASIALYDNRPQQALVAAGKGILKPPIRHPLAVRLRAQAARANARLGQREACEELFAEARELYERLPSVAPIRLTVDTGTLASYAMTAYPASAYIWLKDFERAKAHAEEAVSVHESAPAESCSPSREAIARIDLGIALAELGSADEAVGQGRLALASSRVVDSVLSRAGDLNSVLMARYPDLSDARDFSEQYRQMASAGR